MDVSILFNVPLTECDAEQCFKYRENAAARAQELGWPPSHSAGTYFSYERIVVHLGWKVPATYADITCVIDFLRTEFDVRTVNIR